MKLIWILEILGIFLGVKSDSLSMGSSCTFKGQKGTCTSIDDCQTVKDGLRSGEIGFTEIQPCGFIGKMSLICCPGTTDIDSNIIDRRPSSSPGTKARNACNKYKEEVGAPIDFQILNGIPTSPGEFPHMAALGFREGVSNNLEFKCGGSLISEKYVITAAHCVEGTQKPSIVRLGKTSLKDNEDMTQAVDVEISRFISHPDYRGSQSSLDISLIVLKEEVEFSSYVRPACLDIDLQERGANVTMVATGWGVVNPDTGAKSDVLLKVNLTTIDINSCNRTFVMLNDRKLRSLNNGHMCTLPDGNDTCQGDSGGPLQIVKDAVSTIVGITSSGISCGSRVPGLYTRVGHFIEWIESVVWP